MTVDWSKAPEGATHWNELNCKFYKFGGALVYVDDGGLDWAVSGFGVEACTASCFTPRPAAQWPTQKAYTRDEALQFLVERLDSWPTDIADAPLCPGWGWVRARADDGCVFVHRANVELESPIHHHQWQVARPDFVPFVSLEDAQPAPDMVNHPPHYQSDNGIECIDAIRAALGRDGFVSYCTGNAIKYLWRDKTDRVEDLRKAAWYLNRAIEEVSGDAQTDR